MTVCRGGEGVGGRQGKGSYLGKSRLNRNILLRKGKAEDLLGSEIRQVGYFAVILSHTPWG